MLWMLLVLAFRGVSQNISINIAGTPPDSSAILDVSSSNLGFLAPRMTTTERDGIINPADGLIIYNTVDSALQIFNGVCWLNSYEKDCTTCNFDASLSSSSGTIYRTTSDSITTNINVILASDSVQPINIFLIHDLPEGIEASLNKDTIVGSGNARLSFVADIFADTGTFPVNVKVVCGNTVKNLVYYLTVAPCFEVTISGDHVQYDLQAANGLPTGVPICVTVVAEYATKIISQDTLFPAFTTGNLDPSSHVGLDLEHAEIIGMGGKGGDLGDDTISIGVQGGIGGDAMHLTTKTTIKNNGYIYGGGGGGASVSFSFSVPVPVINTFSFGIGSGGGGGAGAGGGGNDTINTFALSRVGEDGTGGVFGDPGIGGRYHRETTIPLGPVAVILFPDIRGGDGAKYGEAATEGLFILEISATVPVVGTIPIFTINNSHLGGILPRGGYPGKAIVANGNQLIGLPYGNFQKMNVRGVIEP